VKIKSPARKSGAFFALGDLPCATAGAHGKILSISQLEDVLTWTRTLVTKWTRTRRDPARTYTDESTERTERLIAKVRKFLAEGVPEDEPDFIVAVKTAKPKITASELKDVITQFRAVVSERQQRGLGRR
jgi:hypothetical protein